MNYDRNNSSVLSQVSVNKFRTRTVGLSNGKLFCYFNSVLQLFLTIEDFSSFFYSKTYLNVQNKQEKTYCNALSKFVKNIFCLEEEYEYLEPAFFHQIIAKTFDPREQHDAHEFLLFLMGKLQEEMTPAHTTELYQNFKAISS